MTQENVEKEQRSIMRTGGIALICLGALLAGVVVTANTQSYRKHRELRARASSEMSYDQLGIDNSMPGEEVLAFANEQLLAATPDEQHAHDRRMLTGSGSGSGSGAPTASPTASPTTLAPTTVAPTTLAPTTAAPTASPTTVAPTTGAPTPLVTEAAVTYTAASTANLEFKMTVNVDYSDVTATMVTDISDASCYRCSLPSAYCTATAAAGSTVITINIYAAGGASLASITTAMDFANAAAVQAWVQAIGAAFSSWVVTSFESSTTTYSSSSSGLSTGALVGIIVGSVVGVALIVGIIFLVMKKAGSPKGATAPEY